MNDLKDYATKVKQTYYNFLYMTDDNQIALTLTQMAVQMWNTTHMNYNMAVDGGLNFKEEKVDNF